MNNYCRNCGERLTNSNTCEKCGTKVLVNRVGELDKNLERKYKIIFFAILIPNIIIALIMALIGHEYILFAYISYALKFPIISFFLPTLTCFITFAKKKLKYSKFFNIVFWILELLCILFVLFIIFGLISCEYKF